MGPPQTETRPGPPKKVRNVPGSDQSQRTDQNLTNQLPNVAYRSAFHHLSHIPPPSRFGPVVMVTGFPPTGARRSETEERR